MIVIETNIEASADHFRIRERTFEVACESRGNHRVGMNEHQRVARRACGARIHLKGTPADCVDDEVAPRPRHFDAAIGAAAIDDDDLRFRRAGADRVEGPRDRRRLIQHWNDD